MQVEPSGVFEDADVAGGATLDDLLSRWHSWAKGYIPVPQSGADPMFRNVRTPKTWDTTSDAFDDDLNNRIMECIDFQVSQMPDNPPDHGYRSAIYSLARNLSTGRSVWISPRLPRDPMQRAVIVLEARNMLTRRLLAAGVM
ncbi:hypothetical protein [Variovorax sp. JS1663]|uniref:hypothetical protein n=1 Tax=Variovorax sp. JS1663 TaxID=1851577 RepID=UPI000B345F29|nr:hypothetical protein [Variovorax sp. JS1663]OUM00568.1 hypothetical protein A8M77_21110 [Variovorax sp. JS1663]